MIRRKKCNNNIKITWSLSTTIIELTCENGNFTIAKGDHFIVLAVSTFGIHSGEFFFLVQKVMFKSLLYNLSFVGYETKTFPLWNVQSFFEYSFLCLFELLSFFSVIFHAFFHLEASKVFDINYNDYSIFRNLPIICIWCKLSFLPNLFTK